MARPIWKVHLDGTDKLIMAYLADGGDKGISEWAVTHRCQLKVEPLGLLWKKKTMVSNMSPQKKGLTCNQAASFVDITIDKQ